MANQMKRIALLSIPLVFLAACSTIQVHSENGITPKPYLGTNYALHKTKKYWDHYDFYGQVVLVAMDIPLCLIADTLLLPYDAYQSSKDTSKFE